MKISQCWNEETKYALQVYKNVLNIIGVWPLNMEGTASITKWFLAAVLQLSTIIILFLEAYFYCRGSDDMMEAFLMGLSNIVSLAKHLVSRYQWKHKFQLVKFIIEDWSNVNNLRDKEIMLRYTSRGRTVSLAILYLGYASGASFIFMALPLGKLLPFIVPINQSNDTYPNERPYFLATYCVFGYLPLYSYSLVLFIQTIQILTNATSHCGNDGFFFGLTMHLCGQFEILRLEFASFMKDKSTCKATFRVLLEKHLRLAKMACHLEHAFNMAILAQVLMNLLLLCIEGYQLIISLKLNDTFTSSKHTVLIITMLVQLYLYTFAGGTLEQQSEDLAFAVYSSHWYSFESSIVKDLPLVIFRSNNPHQITAGKFLRMNRSTFKDVLKASGSYLSVLRVMVDG